MNYDRMYKDLIKEMPRTADTAVQKKILNQMLSGISDIITEHVAHSSDIEKKVFKMILRFKQDLDRRGYSLRDPEALAQDLLYLTRVNPTADWNNALDVLNEYLLDR